MTPEQHLLFEAREIVPRCHECDRPAEWKVWAYGAMHSSARYVCHGCCPECSEERGGLCREHHDLSGLAAALMRCEPSPQTGGDTEG